MIDEIVICNLKSLQEVQAIVIETMLNTIECYQEQSNNNYTLDWIKERLTLVEYLNIEMMNKIKKRKEQ